MVYTGLPVSGYQPQSEANVDIVNVHKKLEERLLRVIDEYRDSEAQAFDLRLLEIARTQLELGFMALNRAVFRPGRVKLDGDSE